MTSAIKPIFFLTLLVWLGGKLLLKTIFSDSLAALNFLIVTDIAGVIAILLGIVLLVRWILRSRNQKHL